MNLQQGDLSMNRPELIFGLVGAVGTDLGNATDVLETNLERVGYSVHKIRLSDEMRKFDSDGEPSDKTSEYERIKSSMDKGDNIRKKINKKSTVAGIGVARIKEIRDDANKSKNDEQKPLYNTAFILNSLKRPEEIEYLKKIYGENFISISVYCPEEKRIQNLTRRIAKSEGTTNEDQFDKSAKDLMSRDQEDESRPHGQNVRKSFPESDVFFAEGRSFNDQILRFIDILFGRQFITPTKDEYAMFHAFATARRSADLSRQVGAVIVSDEGHILSSGCNEVPKIGGGVFWEGHGDDKYDDRDFHREKDENAVFKVDIIDDMLRRLFNSGKLDNEIKKDDLRNTANNSLKGNEDGFLKGSEISSLLEFGRIVHAEMFAITEAARLGIKINKSDLYCTTFPCHNCARHIIACGIKRVIYIEPYPKSKAKKLYPYSICLEGDSKAEDDAVQFVPFVGISPKMYLKCFTAGPRKDSGGYTIPWNGKESNPIVGKDDFPWYRELEYAIIVSIWKECKKGELEMKNENSLIKKINEVYEEYQNWPEWKKCAFDLDEAEITEENNLEIENNTQNTS